MALTGEAKREYMRRYRTSYMRDYRAGVRRRVPVETPRRDLQNKPQSVETPGRDPSNDTPMPVFEQPVEVDGVHYEPIEEF